MVVTEGEDATCLLLEAVDSVGSFKHLTLRAVTPTTFNTLKLAICENSYRCLIARRACDAYELAKVGAGCN